MKILLKVVKILQSHIGKEKYNILYAHRLDVGFVDWAFLSKIEKDSLDFVMIEKVFACVYIRYLFLVFSFLKT